MTYIDPGSGSYLFQLVVGTALGIGAVVALGFRRTIGRLMRRGSSGRVEAPQPTTFEPSQPEPPRDLRG